MNTQIVSVIHFQQPKEQLKKEDLMIYEASLEDNNHNLLDDFCSQESEKISIARFFINESL